MAGQLDAIPGRAAAVAGRGRPACRAFRDAGSARICGTATGRSKRLGTRARRSGGGAGAVGDPQPLRGRPGCRAAGAGSRRFAYRARRALHRPVGRTADALLRAVANAHRRQHAPRGQAKHRQHRLFRRLQQRGGIQPGVQARIWRAAGHLAPAYRGGGKGRGARARPRASAAASPIHDRRRRDSPRLFGRRGWAADREDGELAQPYRI